jgi:SAM-dependent methyltransferase
MRMRLILALALLVLVLSMFRRMSRQVRKPSGQAGRRMLQAMNLHHATLTDWGLEQVPVARNADILDIGCGGGRTLQRLAELAPEGKLAGIDHSAASVAVSRETNARDIESGRMRIEQGSVAALPFPDGAFDIVTAVETHYYWPDLPANVREIFRVLKPGGTFVLIAEVYRGGPSRLFNQIVMPLLRTALLSDAEHRDLLTQAGFADVATEHVPGKNWICATGRKPPMRE